MMTDDSRRFAFTDQWDTLTGEQDHAGICEGGRRDEEDDVLRIGR